MNGVLPKQLEGKYLREYVERVIEMHHFPTQILPGSDIILIFILDTIPVLPRYPIQQGGLPSRIYPTCKVSVQMPRHCRPSLCQEKLGQGLDELGSHVQPKTWVHGST
jgi:hypothetical protein